MIGRLGCSVAAAIVLCLVLASCPPASAITMLTEQEMVAVRGSGGMEGPCIPMAECAIDGACEKVSETQCVVLYDPRTNVVCFDRENPGSCADWQTDGPPPCCYKRYCDEYPPDCPWCNTCHEPMKCSKLWWNCDNG